MTARSRASGEVTTRFQPAIGKRTALDQFDDHQQALVDLESVAIDLTHNHPKQAEALRQIARRLTA